jgi:hypothetical protein
MLNKLRNTLIFTVALEVVLTGIASSAVADPPPPAADNQYREYWGPMEPNGNPHAGPQRRGGDYMLSFADVPRDASPPEQWPWINVRRVSFQGGRRYFIHFEKDGQIQVHDEEKLPPQQDSSVRVANWASVWFQNSTTNKRIAVRFLPASGHPDEGADEERDPSYWGPMEPLRSPHAGPEQMPGQFRIEWAIVPKESQPSTTWPWQNGPEVRFDGGKRYFVHFKMNGQIQVHAESNLPAEELLVKPVPGRAIVWVQNSTTDKRIAVRFRPLKLAESGTAVHSGERKFTREFPNKTEKISIVIRGTSVTGTYDTGVNELEPKSKESSSATGSFDKLTKGIDLVMERVVDQLLLTHGQFRFEGQYNPQTGQLSGVVVGQKLIGDNPTGSTSRGTFAGTLKEGLLEISFSEDLQLPFSASTHRLTKLVEVRPEAINPVKVVPAVKTKGGDL